MTQTYWMDWSAEQEAEWAQAMDALIARYRSATPTAPRVGGRAHVGPMPQEGISPAAWLEQVQAHGLDHLAAMWRPDCLGHMTSPLPGFMPQLGRLLVALNQNMMKSESSAGLTRLERETVAMLHQRVFQRSARLSEPQHDQVEGVITGGGTLANLMAMWCARKQAFPGEAPWWQQLQQQGYRDAVIIGSRLMHYSFDKASELLALGSAQLLKLEVDAHGSVDLAQLDQTLAACQRERRKVIALVGVAGSTDFCSFDPLHALADRAQRVGAHFHVDAAWGGPFLFAPTMADRLFGIERADTVTLDAHKQLLTPLGCGVLLYRDPQRSRDIMTTAPYAVRPGSWDAGRFTLEGSRPANVLYLHAALHLMGERGYRSVLEKSVADARHLAALIQQHPRLELLLEPVGNVVVFRYLPSSPGWKDTAAIHAFNIRLHKRLRNQGPAFLSRSERVLPGQSGAACTFLRAVINNPLSQPQHLAQLLDDVVRCGLQLEAEAGDGQTAGRHDVVQAA
ncbi:aspartate aminotransferase family protein [Leeia sp.]|uniref:pyridoxal phosphate-dependent decarboxylase family protein n=1 Tax=Leeia sp. TaxID=2884678 RepID=UPI0035AD82D0